MLKLSDLTDPGSARLKLSEDAFGHGACVIRKGDSVYAYLNRCPHTGGPMDWVEGRFLTSDGERIVCALHGAEFRIEDGLCLAGPCVGHSLTAIPFNRAGDSIELMDANDQRPDDS